MPRYFFDIQDGTVVTDYDGLELDSYDAAVDEAVKSLPNIVAHEILAADDRKAISVIVRDSERRAIYTAVLSFCGTRL